MQDLNIEDYIESIYQPYEEGYYIYLPTGEKHNEFQRQGEIQKLIEDEQLHEFHDYAKLLIKYGIPVKRKIINKGSKKPIDKTTIPWKLDGKFIKVYRAEGVDLIMDKTLNVYEKGFLYTIQPFVAWKTNCIVIDGDYPTVEYLAELVCISPRKMNDVLKSLEQKNLIRRYKDGLHKKIFINPNYICAGIEIEGEVPSYFIDEVEEMTKELFNK